MAKEKDKVIVDQEEKEVLEVVKDLDTVEDSKLQGTVILDSIEDFKKDEEVIEPDVVPEEPKGPVVKVPTLSVLRSSDEADGI